MKTKLTIVLTLCLFIDYSVNAQLPCKAQFTTSDYGYNPGLRDIVSADFDGDGNLDLAATTGTNASVKLFYGSASANFSASAIFSAQVLTPYEMVTADFNNDGKPDLAVSNSNPFILQNTNINPISVLLNNGSGGFNPAINFTVTTDSRYIATEDFNGDGNKDLAVSNGVAISILLGIGNGSFSPALTATINGNPWQMITGDFNADGKKDMACTTGSNQIALLYGDGTGNFTVSYITHLSQNARFLKLASADFNGDGMIDIAAALLNAPSSVITYHGNGNGWFQPGNTANVTPGTYFIGMLVEDFNKDNSADMAFVYSGTSSGSVSILFNNGVGQFTTTQNYNVPGNNQGITSGDYNQDGKPDLAVSNILSQNSVKVLLNTTDIPTPSVTAKPNLVCAGESLSLTATGASSYFWSTAEITASIVVHPSTTSNYIINGFGTTGCISSKAFKPDVLECAGVQESPGNLQVLKVYPNPGNGLFTFLLNDPSDTKYLEILNGIGQVIYSTEINSDTTTVDLVKFPAGIYFARVFKAANLIGQTKLVKTE